MKLSQEQINVIEGFLDRMELTQIDLRNEVLDHISGGISDGMFSQQLTFEEAFSIEKQKWSSDLQSHSNFWLGLMWMGPKIMIQKCVKQTKIMYLKATLPAVAVLVLFYSTENLWTEQILVTLNYFVGIAYIGLFLLLLFLNYKMKRTGYQTSYSFLFKINAITFALLLALYNPMVSDILSLEKEGSIAYLSLFAHAFTLAFSWFFVQFYESHSKIQKIGLA